MTTTQQLTPLRGVKQSPLEEFFTSGHRTCQGCESALVMKLMIKAAGPRTIVLGSTGCMYVANTTYYSTPWVVPWMHTQLGSAGSAALGTAAGLKALMRKAKMKDEPINVIAFCGDGGGADMGLSAISATLTHNEYNLLILLYDNESYANTDIQVSGSSPWGANSTFSPPGTVHRIMNKRWKKNTAGMLAAGHPQVRYIATGCASYATDMMNKVRKALSIGGPTFIHTFDPCPKGWDYDPMYSHELGMLGGSNRHLGPVRNRRPEGYPQRSLSGACQGQAAAARREVLGASGQIRPLHQGRRGLLPGAGGPDVGEVVDPRRYSPRPSRGLTEPA